MATVDSQPAGAAPSGRSYRTSGQLASHLPLGSLRPSTATGPSVPAWSPSLLALRSRRVALIYVTAALVGICGAYALPLISAAVSGATAPKPLAQVAAPDFAFPAFAPSAARAARAHEGTTSTTAERGGTATTRHGLSAATAAAGAAAAGRHLAGSQDNSTPARGRVPAADPGS